jgi:trehalose/maltose transport system permease protein
MGTTPGDTLMSGPRALRQSLGLRFGSGTFLALWCLIAAFPIFWIMVMSVKAPLDAFANNPLDVLTGPATLAAGKGLSLLDILFLILFVAISAWAATKPLPRLVAKVGNPALGWLVGSAAFALIWLTAALWVLGPLLQVDAAIGMKPLVGFTTEHYQTVWVDRAFWRNFVNSVYVTLGVTLVSLTVGTFAGYALSRAGSTLAFGILIAALIFRALPHSVLVTGYLPFFITSSEWLRPILGENAPTLYGQPLAVIAVLVAINQPFTIWMLRSFFQSIPSELDEAARVDGCTHFQAFRWVIMPVMWPGVITTGLFSFLLGYNDFLVTSLLLDASNQTMVPAIASFFNRETTTTDQVLAVAAAVSITAPLFLLVMVFQRQIVSGLTAGAVKG